jgi:hypothetical protein
MDEYYQIQNECLTNEKTQEQQEFEPTRLKITNKTTQNSTTQKINDNIANLIIGEPLNLNSVEVVAYIYQLRALQEKSLAEMERRTDLSYQSIRKYEQGKSKFTLEALALILQSLGLEASITLRKKPKNEPIYKKAF